MPADENFGVIDLLMLKNLPILLTFFRLLQIHWINTNFLGYYN